MAVDGRELMELIVELRRKREQLAIMADTAKTAEESQRYLGGECNRLEAEIAHVVKTLTQPTTGDE